jgi:hypothetical protein
MTIQVEQLARLAPTSGRHIGEKHHLLAATSLSRLLARGTAIHPSEHACDLKAAGIGSVSRRAFARAIKAQIRASKALSLLWQLDDARSRYPISYNFSGPLEIPERASRASASHTRRGEITARSIQISARSQPDEAHAPCPAQRVSRRPRQPPIQVHGGTVRNFSRRLQLSPSN